MFCLIFLWFALEPGKALDTGSLLVRPIGICFIFDKQSSITLIAVTVSLFLETRYEGIIFLAESKK